MKVFANKKMKQFIIILVTVIMLFNVIAPAPLALQVQAAEVFGTVTNGIVDIGGGILMQPIAKFIAGVAFVFQQLLNGVGNLAAALSGGNLPTWQGDVFISTIVYNQLPIIDANVFNPNTQNPLLQSENGGGISGIVKTWYSITRLMALAASLVVLVYVAIKIILSSTGQSKAKYTELLKDWLLSLLLIFSLHYVMAAILFCNDAIVKFFANIVNSGGTTFSYQELQSEAIFNISISSLIYSIIWLVFLGFTFVFLILYIKRLILICFFVIISPIIVLLNTINKIRGKGSDLLSNWLKQFIANVVMQPIDALLLTVVLSSINLCLSLQPKQPLVALAFLIGYYPLRNWVLKFFDQNAEQNTLDGAKGMFSKGLASVGRVGSGVAAIASNVSKIPNLNNEKLSKRLDTISRVGNGVSTVTNIGANARKDKSSYEPNKGFQGGYAELSPEMIERANAEMTGDTNQPSSYTSTVATGGKQPSSNEVKKGKLSGKGAMIGRAIGVAAPKLVGAGVGISAMALNVAAGNGAKGFTGAMNATENIIKAPSKLIKENGGLISTGAATAQYFKDRVASSYIVTGEHGAYQKRLEESNFWFGDELQAYAREDLAINGTQEEIQAYNETDDQKLFLADRVRTQTRNVEGFDRMVAVEGGNVRKIERKVAQKNIDKWKKKGITLNSSRNQVVHSSTNVATEEVYRKPQGKVETVRVENTESSVVTETREYIEEPISQQEADDFFGDPKTEDIAYELITTMGEGHPLYEEFNRVTSESARKKIAYQFLVESANDKWNEKDFAQIIRSKNHQELQKLLKK